jgi:hypothetical protein
LQNWLRVMANGGGVQAVRQGLLSSQEYFNRQGGTTVGFVQGLYQALLGRSAGEREVTRWAAVAGRSRAEAVRGVLASDEFRGQELGSLYQAYLGRGVDAAGLRGWLESFRHGMTWERVEVLLLNSLEYRSRL